MSRHRYANRLVAAIALLGVASTMLSGCTVLDDLFSGPAPPKREVAAEPAEPPKFVKGGTAEENLPYFTEVLRTYSKGTGAIKGKSIVNAVAKSGFKKKYMQVSFDKTKTDLDADSIYVSVRVAGDCLIGQLVTEDRSFAAQVEPVVGPKENLCLIGETRDIDW